MSDLSPQDIKRLRESEFFKLENKSDFKSIRDCFLAAKHLYECLKFFDSRATRFADVPVSKRMYDLKRRFSHPQDYYHFQTCDVDITIFRYRSEYNVVVDGRFRPSCLGDELIGEVLIPRFHRYLATNLLSECVDGWLSAVEEYISSLRSDDFVSQEVSNELF